MTQRPPALASDGAPWIGRLLLCVAIVLGAALATRGITDEGAVSLQGDMPRYMMNGVFIRDFLADPVFTIDGVLTYAQHYFARYPALSLGHHPPVLPLLLVPFYAVFGVSILAGRLAIAACFLLAIWLLYTLARRQYGTVVAGWAALLMASHPFMIRYSQEVLSEMPTIVVILAAFNALLRFRDRGRAGDYLLFVGLAASSLASKQLAVFVFPAYVVLLLMDGGWARLRQRNVWGWTIAGAALVVALVAVTVVLSPYNVAIALDVIMHGVGLSSWRTILAPILQEHLRPSLLYGVAAAVVAAIVARDRRAWLAASWILAVLAGVVFVTGPWDVARYAIYAAPAYCLMAASLAADARTGMRSLGTAAVLLVIVALQVRAGAAVEPVGGRGYEQAAMSVLAGPSAPTVLYSASVDTGYFVFFTRKHDAARQLVVLRSDKILTTSFMDRLSVEARITDASEIYPLLDRYGTRFVVIEDRPTGSNELDWLREEVKGDRFLERERIPIGTRDRRLQGVDLVIYEYKDAKAGDPDAELDMELPLVDREIRVKLSDLRRPPAP